MNEIQLKEKIALEISKFKNKKGIYTFISKPEDYHIVNQEIIRFLTKNLNISGIYVTLNTSHCDMVKKFKAERVDTEKLLFIDNIETGGGCKAHNCIFLGNTKSLTALSLGMSKACENKSMEFIFFDSVTTILIYNTLKNTERFIHYFINKIKNLDILMIVISIEEPKSNKLTSILSQFCDGCIKI